MEKCLLCKKNDADATNSHIITWGLIKEAINRSGFKERNYETTYSISNFDIPKLYTGRSILPEHIEDILGYQPEDKQITNNKDPLSRDNIFCDFCESALGKIESEFIEKVYGKLIKQSFSSTSLDSKGNKVVELADYHSKLTKLLAYTLFFRTSLVKLNNVALNPKIHENIRLIILSTLSDDNKILAINIKKLKEEEFIYPLVITYLETNADDENGQNVVIQNRSDFPYFILANRMIFQLFQKEKQVYSSIQNFYGLYKILNNRDYFSSLADKVSIGIIENSKRSKLITTALQFLAEDNIENGKALLRKAFKLLMNRNPSEEEIGAFTFNYSQLFSQKLYGNIRELFFATFQFTFIKKPTVEELELLLKQ